MAPPDSIQFEVNGKSYTVNNPEIGLSLNSWLRSSARLTGTKVMCAEGGCGACVVTLTRSDPVTGVSKSMGVNSCLLPLLSVDGCQVTTTEGLVGEDGTYDAVQERVAQFNATQCGYCTPGFVMTMHSFLQQNPNPTQEEIEEEFDGNLCRCTGYRPIFDAMKSFATDAEPKLKKICADIEDMKITREKCNGEKKNCHKSCGRCSADGLCNVGKKKTQDSIRVSKSRTAIFNDGTSVWARPSTLNDLSAKVKEFINSGKTKIRFVVGNTGSGVYKNDGTFDLYVDSKEVKELYQITNSTDELVIGANVSLNDVISELKTQGSSSEIFSVMANHIKKVANVPVRNVGCWAGNLMLKKVHPEFPSDIFTLFCAYDVKLNILDCVSGSQHDYSLIGLNSFMTIDMTGKIILTAKISKAVPSQGKLKALSYKVMPRSQNAHAYVNAAFSANIVSGTIQNASLSFGGISENFYRAFNTEQYLNGKDANSQDVLTGALQALEFEVNPVSYSAADSSPEYRKSLALGLFYKFFLYLSDALPLDLASAIDNLERPVTSSTRTYDTNASEYPITEPIPKVTAIKQASGEAKYISDFAGPADGLYATFVLSETANADIDAIDTTDAKNMAGFHSIITASDFPAEVQNSFAPPPYGAQVILAESHVDHAGQPVAIVLADSIYHAEEIAKAVKITYKNQGPIVVDLEEAIDKAMFYNLSDQCVVGDADTALKNAKNKVSGRLKIGSQYHFFMETHIARAAPTEDGFEVKCGSQWMDFLQLTCANILGWDVNRISVKTGRVGGAFGGKAFNSFLCGSLALVSSYISGRPVCFHGNLSQCMKAFGCRAAYVVDYTVGFDENGILGAVEASYYANSGSSQNDCEFFPGTLAMYADSGYRCPNWKLNAKNVKTDMTSTSICRAPVTAQCLYFIDAIMEHVAKYLKQDPMNIKQLNLYQDSDVDLSGNVLENFMLPEIVTNLLASAKVTERQSKIDLFNKENKWKKKGIGFIPMKYAFNWGPGHYSTQVNIFANDGSIILSFGGIECGQGINTKLIQIASYVLGAPMDLIRVVETSILRTPNSAPTGGSLTSEMCGQGILQCCMTLKNRIDAVMTQLKLSDDISWKEKIARVFAAGVDLTATNWVTSSPPKIYNVCAAGLSEVEMDILTGEYAIKRVDLLYDCGNSVNPEIDVGQAEGAFMYGVGYYTSEKMSYDSTSGQLATHNTWEYKPPSSKDIPTEWNIAFWRNPSSTQVLSSKAVGEPPLILSSSVVIGIKRCIEAFKSDNKYFALELPATVDIVQQLSDIKITDYTV